MIWICTLFLLVVAAWLFFNAMNERRWVLAHSHDETVAADEGLFPAFTALTGSGSLPHIGKVSIGQEDSRFARAVGKIQDTTAKYGEKFFESKVAAARIDDPEKRPRSAREENTLFGRAVARVSEKVEKMDQKLDVKIKEASSQTRSSADSADEGVLTRVSRKVAATSDELSTRMANQARNKAQGKVDDQPPPMAPGDRMFEKVRARVSDGMHKFESTIDTKVAASRQSAASGDEDLMTRVASKVGNRIGELDKKFVSASKKVAGKLDKH
ncbi:MAG: hypothetical protein AB8B97_21535 [Granulosicoccus sp.]